jgi:hypothetical protein
MILDRWLRTKREWMAAAIVVPLLAVVAFFSLLGYETAAGLLVALGGCFIGTCLAYPIASSFRQRFASRFGSWRGPVASALGLASVITIIFSSSYVLDIPTLASEDHGISGVFVFGLAIGFGGALRQRLARTPKEEREAREATVRLVFAVAGAAAALYILLFGVFVLIDYVAAPLIRYFAG